jgi:hypothetical protein
LEILVGIDKAWKKEVFSGPRPVFWGSMSTGIGAKAPALSQPVPYVHQIVLGKDEANISPDVRKKPKTKSNLN